MPLRSNYGLFYRHTYFCFNCFENVLWTSESKLLYVRPSEFFRKWKFKIIVPFARAWSLDLSSQPKEGLSLCSFSCPVGFEERVNKRGATDLTSFEMGNRQFCDFVGINKSITPHGPSPSHSILSRNVAMRGFIVSNSMGTRFWSDGRRTHMGHAHGHDNHEKLGAYGEKILQWGLWSDIILTISKVAAGYVSGSTAIIADAAHSASDIGLSGLALWCSKASKAPPDQEHPYGYGKIETMGALIISTLLLVTGGGIAWSAADALQVLIPAMLTAHDTITQTTVDTAVHQEVHRHGHNHEHGVVAHKHVFDTAHMEVALFAAIVGIGAKEGLYWITKAAGEKSGSALLKANAWHHRGDAVSTIVALVGVGGAMMGMPFLDPVAALLVSGMIIKAGLQYGYQSMQELLDKGLPPPILTPIRETVLQVDGVKGIHQLRGRRMGSIVEVDAHIEVWDSSQVNLRTATFDNVLKVDPLLSVSAAHTIGEAVRQHVRTHHPNISESFVHIDPADGRPSLSAPGGMHKHCHGYQHDEHLHTNKNSHGDHHVEHTHEPKHLHDIQHLHSHDHDHDHKHHHNGDSHGHNHDRGRRVEDENERVKDLNRVGQKVLAEIQANFGEVVKVRTVTCRFLQGKVFAEVGISLDPNLSIRDAMRHASEMETRLIQNVEGLATISVQLHLSTS